MKTKQSNDFSTYLSTDFILDEIDLKLRNCNYQINHKGTTKSDLDFYMGKLAAYSEVVAILKSYQKSMLKTGTEG